MTVAFKPKGIHKAVTEKTGNITEPDEDATQGTEDAPSEDPAKISEAHGPAEETNIRYDSAGAHVTSRHADGFEHTSTHLDRERAFQAARQHAGLDIAPPDTAEKDRSRSAEVGPKEKERIDREDGRIPGYDR